MLEFFLQCMFGIIVVIAVSITWHIIEHQKARSRLEALTLADVDSMSGHFFEHYVAWLLRAIGYKSVTVTTGSRDYGADIIASKGTSKYSIQVKRQSSTVSRRAISDAVGAMQYYKCNCSMVITNNHFSKPATLFAARSHCVLVDREKLADWIIRAKEDCGSVHPPPGENSTPTKSTPNRPPSIIHTSCEYELFDSYTNPAIDKTTLSAIKKEVSKNWGDELYDFQLDELKEHIVAYENIRTFDYSPMPRDVFDVILNKAQTDSQHDYIAQLCCLVDEVKGYRFFSCLSRGQLTTEQLTNLKNTCLIKADGSYDEAAVNYNHHLDEYKKLLQYKLCQLPGGWDSDFRKFAALENPSSFQDQLNLLRSFEMDYLDVSTNLFSVFPKPVVQSIISSAKNIYPSAIEDRLQWIEAEAYSYRNISEHEDGRLSASEFDNLKIIATHAHPKRYQEQFTFLIDLIRGSVRDKRRK